MNTVRIGFVGAGHWGLGKHLPSLKHISSCDEYDVDVEFTHLVEFDDEHRKKVQEKWGFAKAGSSIEEMVKDDEVDAVYVIINPARLNEVLPLIAASGKPVFCEKPPAPTYQDALTNAKMMKQPNLVAFNRRFHPLVQELKTRLNGVNIHSFQAQMLRHNRLDSFLTRSDPMATPFFKVTGIHLLDMLRYMVGDYELQNIVSLEREAGVNDGRLAWAVSETGAMGQLTVLPTCGRNEELVEIHTPESSYRLEIRLDETEPSRLTVWHKGKCVEAIVEDTSQPVLWRHGYIGEHLEFLHALREKRATISSFQNTADSLRLAERLEEG